jgi:hypothetical protein
MQPPAHRTINRGVSQIAALSHVKMRRNQILQSALDTSPASGESRIFNMHLDGA